MNDNQRYRIQEKIRYDKQQLLFGELGLEKNTNPLAVDVISLDNKIVFCPFCLAKKDLIKFAIGNKKGFSRRYAKCPECNTLMLLETLIRMLKWNPKEYAEFVFNYPPREFFAKCSFNKWKKRMYDLDIATDFWNRYRELRASSRDLSDEEYH